MSRAEEWEKELINRFPTIDRAGLPATAKFIAIIEEMGGFDEGVYLDYHFLTHDITITSPTSDWLIAPTYYNNQVSSFRCIFYSASHPSVIKRIQSTPNAMRDFLSVNWSELFPKEATW